MINRRRKARKKKAKWLTRVFVVFGLCLFAGLGRGGLFGQAPPCLGGEEDPYLITAPRPYRAQSGDYQPLRPLTRMEIGVRQVAGDRKSAKFLEYRDIPRGVFINNLFSCAEDPAGGFYYRLLSQESLEMDQHSLLTAGLPGRMKFIATWDRTLHTVNSAGRNHFERTAEGEFTLPPGTQALEGAQPVDLLLKRNTARVGAVFTPTEAWDLRADYSRENRSGFRPVGANVAFSVVELPEPNQYRTNDVKLSTEFAKRKWLVRVDSQTSIFSDKIKALEWTNPLQDPADSSSPARGRRALAPDNHAQTFTFAGAADLGKSARIVATLSPGWMSQDEAFLPFTANTALLAQPGFPDLPASSPNGRRQTLMMNYLITGKVGEGFGYNARYRTYRLDNETPSLTFSNYVRYDSLLPSSTPFTPQARRNLPYGYRKQNFTFDWNWEPNKDSTAKVFYKWEGWERQFRNVADSNEHTTGGAWDWSPAPELFVETSFQHSMRKPRSYDPQSFLSAFPDGVAAFELGQLDGLRRFDQAQRSRNEGDVLVEVTPAERVTFSASYTTDRSVFGASAYGLLDDWSDTASFDVAYILTPSITLFGEYSYERFRYAQRSRERLSGTFLLPGNDSANNDWESNARDRIHTWGGGVNSSLWRDRIVADLYWGLSQSQSRTTTAALGNPSLEGFLVNTAEDYPNTSDRFQQWVVSVKLPQKMGFSQRFLYTYERFTERDMAADQAGILPGLEGAGSLFLAPLFSRYRVHILSYTLSFVF